MFRISKHSSYSAPESRKSTLVPFKPPVLVIDTTILCNVIPYYSDQVVFLNASKDSRKHPCLTSNLTDSDFT